MTREGLARVLGLAIMDERFRRKLKEDPEHAEIVSSLSDEEIKFLKDEKNLENIAEFSNKLKIKYDKRDPVMGPNKSH